MFEPAKNFMFLAAKKYNLESQALGSLVCERARQIIDLNFTEFAAEWSPIKYKDQTLTIQAFSAASSSALFMQSHQLIEYLEAESLPETVTRITIKKTSRATLKDRY